jgi:hypothetical protein
VQQLALAFCSRSGIADEQFGQKTCQDEGKYGVTFWYGGVVRCRSFGGRPEIHNRHVVARDGVGMKARGPKVPGRSSWKARPPRPLSKRQPGKERPSTARERFICAVGFSRTTQRPYSHGCSAQMTPSPTRDLGSDICAPGLQQLPLSFGPRGIGSGIYTPRSFPSTYSAVGTASAGTSIHLGRCIFICLSTSEESMGTSIHQGSFPSIYPAACTESTGTSIHLGSFTSTSLRLARHRQ